jgi:GntR family transcriptional regulator, transcriptional repressor for pyruvate dehydrogenase complex
MGLMRKSYEIVADDLEQMIENGALKPGDKLQTIDKLAEQYGVGKSTIREALSQLKARGLVESKQGEGTFVKKNANVTLKEIPILLTGDPAELYQLLQTRTIVETGCAALAALHHDEQDILFIEDILSKMASSLGQEDLSRMYDIQFHKAIASATKNPFLKQIMESVSEAMNPTIRDSRTLWLYKKEGTLTQLYGEHRDIFEAISSRNPVRARTLMEQHLNNVKSALDSHLN